MRFQIADLHGERRLGDCARLRRAAEMAEAGQCVEIVKLPQGVHVDQINLSDKVFILIGTYDWNGSIST
jgi:hypothetical protein